MRRSFGTLLCLATVLVGLEAIRPASAERTPSDRLAPGRSAPGESAPGPAAARSAPGPITVRADRPGHRMPVWGYDIKQSCPPYKSRKCRQYLPVRQLNSRPRYVRAVFGSGRMNLIRIPLRADRRGVRANGLVKKRYYRGFIKATRKAMRARHGQRLIVFANRVTVNDCAIATAYRPVRCPDFARSLKSRGKVNPAKYARLLGSYLRHFRRHGIRIDVLGIENEPSNNEGLMLRNNKYTRVVQALRRRWAGRMPRITMIDSGNPRPGWLRHKGRQRIRRGDAWNTINIATTHYSSRKRGRTRHAFGKFSRVAHGRGVRSGRKRLVPWDTEFHWNNLPRRGPYAEARHGLFSVFDHSDFRYRGLVWWAFHPWKRGGMQRRVVNTLGQSRRLPVEGRNGAARGGRMTVRAFRRGGKVFVWVINDTGRTRRGQSIEVEGAGRGGRATYIRWRRGSGGKLQQSSGGASGLLGNTRTTLPARSITLVRIPVG